MRIRFRAPVVLAVVALVATWAPPLAHAHCADRHTGDHPHCINDPGSSDGVYDVTIGLDAEGNPTGELFPKVGTPQVFEGKDGGGRSKPVQVYFQWLDLDLSYFAGFFGPSGEACFGAAPIPNELTALVISEESDGSALARLWFKGYGFDGTTQVDYQLLMWGDFSTAWRPAEVGDSTTATLSLWQMRTTNKKHKNISCRVGYDFDVGVPIEVVRTN